MTRRLLLMPAAAVLLVSAGCSVTPKYHAPAVPAPASFTGQESNEWKVASPADAVSKGNWWEIFQDPDLNALEQQVDTANENLKIAEARFRQARALVRENRSGLFPTVTASASLERNRRSFNKPGVPAGSPLAANDFVLPVDVSYEADVWGRIRSLVASSQESAQASGADVEAARLSVHAELALDYYDLRSVDEEKRILENSVTAYERALQLTQDRFQGGVATRVEVSQAQTQLESTRAQAIDVTERRSRDEHAIAVLIGQVPERFSVAGKANQLQVPVIPTGVPARLLERRPDIAAAERRIASANSQIGFARAAFYPKAILGGVLGLEGGGITNWLTWPSRFWAIGPSALQTLFDAGRRRAVVEESTANYDALVAGYREMVLGAFQQVEDELASLRILEQESKRQLLAVEAARRTQELSMNRYRGGIVTYLEVVTAQSVALQNERLWVDLQRRRMESSVLLIKALGGGWS